MHIRCATFDDLNGIMSVEQSWHEDGRASEEIFVSRIKRFSQGFFLALVNDGEEEKVIATITSMPFHYSREHISECTNWNKVTGNGYLPEVLESGNENGLYIVSGIIDRNYRGNDIFSPMVSRIVELSSELDYRYIVAGAVMPGFKKYHQKLPDRSPYEYCSTRKGHSLMDPLLAMYEKLDFTVPDEHHVIAEYFPDDASMNYAALVVRDLGQVK